MCFRWGAVVVPMGRRWNAIEMPLGMDAGGRGWDAIEMSIGRLEIPLVDEEEEERRRRGAPNNRPPCPLTAHPPLTAQKPYSFFK